MIKIRNLCFVLIVSFVLLGLSSCDLDFVDIDKNYDGLSIGFNHEYDTLGIICAVRSNQTEFNIDNVTLDCYYGWYTYSPMHFYKDGIYDPVCIALYYGGINMHDVFDDYKNIENMHFLKEISIEEFSTEAFNMKMTKQEGKTFEQSDSFTIPKELFVKPGGGVSLVVVNIGWNPNENVYFTRGFGFCAIQYDFIDEETVSLYK